MFKSKEKQRELASAIKRTLNDAITYGDFYHAIASAGLTHCLKYEEWKLGKDTQVDLLVRRITTHPDYCTMQTLYDLKKVVLEDIMRRMLNLNESVILEHYHKKNSNTYLGTRTVVATQLDTWEQIFIKKYCKKDLETPLNIFRSHVEEMLNEINSLTNELVKESQEITIHPYYGNVFAVAEFPIELFDYLAESDSSTLSDKINYLSYNHKTDCVTASIAATSQDELDSILNLYYPNTISIFASSKSGGFTEYPKKSIKAAILQCLDDPNISLECYEFFDNEYWSDFNEMQHCDYEKPGLNSYISSKEAIELMKQGKKLSEVLGSRILAENCRIELLHHVKTFVLAKILQSRFVDSSRKKDIYDLCQKCNKEREVLSSYDPEAELYGYDEIWRDCLSVAQEVLNYDLELPSTIVEKFSELLKKKMEEQLDMSIEYLKHSLDSTENTIAYAIGDPSVMPDEYYDTPDNV